MKTKFILLFKIKICKKKKKKKRSREMETSYKNNKLAKGLKRFLCVLFQLKTKHLEFK